MNLDELQSVRDRERQKDQLQQLRESFYEDAGELIQQLRRERERAAERAEDPFDSTTVTQLSDEIRTAEQMVEAIYEKRIGKIVKAASFDAAGLPAEAEGMTAEEQDLFERLVRDIQQNRERVLAVIDGSEAGDPSADAEVAPSPVGTDASGGVPAAAAMGGGTGDSSDKDASDTETAEEASGAPSGDDGESGHSPHPPPPPERERPPDASDGETMADSASQGEPDRDERTGGSPPSRDEPETESDDTTTNRNADADDGAGSDTDDATTPDTDPDSDDGGPGTAVDPENDEENPVREDGSGVSSGPGETAQAGAQPAVGTQAGSEPEAGAGAVPDPGSDPIERKTVRILESVETFVGFDDRDYDLAEGDVVTLPATNADLLLERGVAKELE